MVRLRMIWQGRNQISNKNSDLYSSFALQLIQFIYYFKK